MTKRVRRIATQCILGLIAFSGKSIITEAAEIPIAGIDVVLNEFYVNKPSTITDITEYLTPKISSEYEDIAIARVSNYLNIRSEAREDSEIVGKLYNNSVATILDTEGNWYKIKSGSVTGYLLSDYVVTGEDVVELAKKVGRRIATVTTTTLKVREEPSLEASVQTLVPIGEELDVIKEVKGWVKISIDNDVDGYVSSNYIELSTEFDEAVSKEEEIAKLQAEEAARKAAADEARRAAQVASRRTSTSNNTKAKTSSTLTPKVSTNTSAKRNNIVQYALRFVGNPYVWGGTSLMRGADCSGFTQSVFRDNGISIPRSSRVQASGGGRSISISNVKPGDLIFYAKRGTINHVAIYIGNGKVVGASSPKTGIKITNYNYRQPYKVVNYID